MDIKIILTIGYQITKKFCITFLKGVSEDKEL